MDFFADSITPPATTATARELFSQPATSHRLDGLDLNSQISSDFPNFGSYYDYLQSPSVNNNEADNVARQSTTSKQSRGAGGKRAAAANDPAATAARPFRVPRTASSSIRGGRGGSRAMSAGRARPAANVGGTSGGDGTSWQTDIAPGSAARSGARARFAANIGGDTSWWADATTRDAAANIGGSTSWQADAATWHAAENGGRARLAANTLRGTSWQADAAPGLEEEDETFGHEYFERGAIRQSQLVFKE